MHGRLVSAPSLMVSRTCAGGGGRPSRALSVRGDRLTQLETHVVNVMRSGMRMSTEAVLDAAPAKWLESYAGLFDSVNVPFSGPEDWDRVRHDARRARGFGLELRLRTLVHPGNACTDISAEVMELAPEAWTLVPDGDLAPDELHRFTIVNARAMEEIGADVHILWGCSRTRFPRRKGRSRDLDWLLE